MATYSIGSRGWSRAALFVLAVPAYVSIAHLVWLKRHGDSSDHWPGNVIFTLILGWSIYKVARRIVGIRIAGDGVISFIRTIGRTDVAASQIVRLVGEYVPGYDEPEWTMRIDLAHGRSIRVSEFTEARDFAVQATALNPNLDIWGTWPMGAPEVRPRLNGSRAKAA
jgi:hypothetical protein